MDSDLRALSQAFRQDRCFITRILDLLASRVTKFSYLLTNRH
jgi:hypothetical protein